MRIPGEELLHYPDGNRLMIGTKLGPYEITAKLGEGGMGEVYRATDGNLRREVAIKVLAAAFTEDPGRLSRFEREAHLLAQLHHPNIATIFGLEEFDAKRALVMELVEGPTLAERLKSGALELEESLTIARQVAEALEEAHEKGIIHRDLKPGNVIAPVDGKIKVLDFGLAKAMDPLSDAADAGALVTQSPTLTAGATAQGVILGTAAYMAPEQAKGTAVDKRADIWAFGVVLYEMLTGARLFDAPTVPEILAQVLTKKPDLEALPASTPAPVRRLLRRCLVRHPKDRLHDIADARLVFDDLGAGRAGVAAEEAESRSAPAMTGPAWLLAAAALAVGVLGTLGAESWLGRGRTVPPATAVRAKIPLQSSQWHYSDKRPLALSPDGSRLAITLWDPTARRQSLYLRSLDDLQLQPLADTEGAGYPFWSPDGGALGFFADERLRRLDLASGAVRTLCDAPQARGGSWSPRGTIVFSRGARGPLLEVSADGGTPAELTTLARAGEGQRSPHYLPDGRSVLFWAMGRGAPEERAVYGFSAGRGEVRKILDSPTEALYVEPGYLAFVADGNLMLQPFDAERLELSGSPRPLASGVSYSFFRHWVAADLAPGGHLVYLETPRPEPFHLSWLDADGNESAAWSGTIDEFMTLFQVSPDGRRAAVVWWDGNDRSRCELLDFEAGTRVRIGRPGLRTDSKLVWSPDGERLAFGFWSGGEFEFGWMPPRPDEVPRALTSRTYGDWYYAGGFTPDGRSVLVQRGTPEDLQMDVFLVDLEGGAAPRPFLSGPAEESWPSPSPGGGWVSFRSDAGERREIWVTDYPGAGGRWQVSKDLGGNWGWLSVDELWWVETDRRLVAAKIRRRGTEVEVFARRPLLGGRALTETEVILDYSGVRQRFLLGRTAEPQKDPDLVVLSDWRAALRAGGTKP